VGWGCRGSKVFGAWETGEGERVPPPRQPHPPWRYPHGPAHGEILERNRARWPTGCTPDTASHLISPRTDPAPGRGRGRSAEGAGGVGMPAEAYEYPLPQARAGWGVPAEEYGYSRGKAGGVRVPANCVGLLCRRRGQGGGCRRGIRLPCSGAGRVAICPLTLPPGRSVHHCRPDSRELPWPSREFIVGAVQDHRRGQFHATR